jgi:UDP-N-acetylmuramyl pentapeptide phosphotransferase/UDP-N-acetylglucosamine-1-phosphate transferase
MPPLFLGLVTFLFCGYVFGLIPNPFLMLTLVTFFTVTGGALTYLLVKVLNRAAIYDNPNDRSMHSIPTPRGGGWSYVILLAIGFGLVLSCGFSQSLMEFNFGTIFGGKTFLSNIGHCILLEHETLLLFVGFIFLALVSWWDDCRGVPARLRLLAQFVAVAIPLHSYPVEILFPNWLPYPVALVFVLLAWIWFINLYNFMDGIDGITAMETICISGVIALLGLKFFNNVIVLNDLVLVLSIVLFSVSVGFLQFNWHPAQIFLGDVGSVSIGYILGFCLLHIAALGYWQIALTLPLYYLADSGITLVRRLLHGDRVWEAHRTHLYQIAAQMSGRHDIVVLKIAACNLILAIIAIASIFWGAWVCLAAPIPVAILYAHFAKQARMAYLSIWQS